MGDASAAPSFQESLEIRGAENWSDALLAADILAIAGNRIGGLWLKARAGGSREVYLDHLQKTLNHGRPWLRVPGNASLSGLLGGIDIAATATSGHLVSEAGLLSAADGSTLLIPMAERLEPAVAAVIADAMDCGSTPDPTSIHARRPARFSAILIDESEDGDGRVPVKLTDRLGLIADLTFVTWSRTFLPDADAERPDWQAVQAVALSGDIIALLSKITAASGKHSVRVLQHLATVCRILAALSHRTAVTEADAVIALRLTLGVRLMSEPAEPPAQNPDPEPPPPPPSDGGSDNSSEGETDIPPLDALTELLAAVEAGNIAGMPLLATSERAARAKSSAGKAGAMHKDVRRGRPFALSQSPPYPDARPDVVATLRAAAPFQRIRARHRAALAVTATVETAKRPPLLIRQEDFRYKRLRHEAPSTAIFMVDASGSTALERLGETKGAIEQLLAKCYVRRDEVALVTFRGLRAEVTLPPTRSLVLAKRTLAGLPGGGPTPLVSGLEKGLELALTVRRSGGTPVLVLMTDGSGNIALDGTPDRALAARQLEQLSALYRFHGLHAICIDIARRPREQVAALARALAADHHVLPHADARRMSELVNASMEEVRA